VLYLGHGNRVLRVDDLSLQGIETAVAVIKLGGGKEVSSRECLTIILGEEYMEKCRPFQIVRPGRYSDTPTPATQGDTPDMGQG
jgi:hypothetical protein